MDFSTIQNKEERLFVDREDTLKLVKAEYSDLVSMKKQFSVIEIFGMGGIGKSRFLRTIKKEFSDKKTNLVFVSFEIKRRGQELDNLISIRKKFGNSMLRFDFALLNYWDRNRTEKLDDSFMDYIHEGFVTTMSDTVTDFASRFLPLELPSLGDMVGALNTTAKKYNEVRARQLTDIAQWSDSDLIENMPILLGMDIKDILSKAKTPYIFIFDSYEQSQPYSESREWLLSLIGSIHTGLHIVSGREKLKWKDTDHDMCVYQLSSLPQEATNQLLQKYLLPKDYSLIPLIIKTTEGIPIFLNLILDIYKQGDQNKHSLVDRSLLSDRNKLVVHFINHLPLHYQAMIMTLAIVRVFDADIFEYLNQDLSLGFHAYEFEDLCEITLVNYIEYTSNLYKFHDIFSLNATHIHSSSQLQRIYKSYLTFLSTRGLHQYSKESMATLFLNLIDILKKNALSGDINTESIEMILRVFLHLMAQKVNFELPQMSDEKGQYQDLLLFMYAVYYEKKDTEQTIAWLENINSPQNFGRYSISIRLLLLYNNSLLGKYDQLGQEIQIINSGFKKYDVGEWYYLKAKYYLGDYLLLEGKFKEAVELYTLTMSEFDSLSLDDRYHMLRSIGHVQRFNFQLSMALRTYEGLLNDYRDITSLELYLQTNICETACYFDHEIFNKHCKKAFQLTKQFDNKKNLAKMYYSQAIVHIVKKEYCDAQKCINESIHFNNKDSYQSGVLFALMAQSYLEYSMYGAPQKTTLNDIEALLLSNNVYTYFRLTLCIMNGSNSEIEQFRDKYSWLDFDNTIHECKRFLNQL